MSQKDIVCEFITLFYNTVLVSHFTKTVTIPVLSLGCGRAV
jgi:hypothetical protein